MLSPAPGNEWNRFKFRRAENGRQKALNQDPSTVQTDFPGSAVASEMLFVVSDEAQRMFEGVA